MDSVRQTLRQRRNKSSDLVTSAPRSPEEVRPDQIKPQDVQKVVEACWGVTLSLNEARQLLEMAGQDPENPHNAFGAMICPKWTSLGFTSHGHTGGDVPLFAFGPGRPAGLLDGPEIGKLTDEETAAGASPRAP